LHQGRGQAGRLSSRSFPSEADRKYLWLGLAAGLAIFAGALAPPPPYFQLVDKIAHVCAFALLAALMRRGGLNPFLIVAGLGAFALSIELAQAYLVTGRTASEKDIVASLFGVVLGAALPRTMHPAFAAAAVLGLAFGAQEFHVLARPLFDNFVRGVWS
jgi:VanZ family protein